VTLDHVLDPEADLFSKQLRQLLDRLINRLRPREGLAIRYRYGIHSEPMKLHEIADRYGVTKERVRQIILKGLRQLRRLLRREFPEIVAAFRLQPKRQPLWEPEPEPEPLWPPAPQCPWAPPYVPRTRTIAEDARWRADVAAQMWARVGI
jgi:hypothetical protein